MKTLVRERRQKITPGVARFLALVERADSTKAPATGQAAEDG